MKMKQESIVRIVAIIGLAALILGTLLPTLAGLGG